MNKQTTFKFTRAQVESACDEACKHTAQKYKVQGFRDGKAPRKVIEQQYGDVFTEPALNQLFGESYMKFLRDNKLNPIADPDVDAKKTPDGGFEFNVTIPIQDEFKLGKYTGLTYEKHKINITDREVDMYLEKLQHDRARGVPAPKGAKIQKGNIAVIDFVGMVDGKEFQGGSAKNHELEIGSKQFIDTFEDQLVGHAIGDKIDIKVKFPADYHAKELANKPAIFKTTVNGILMKQLPAIDDNLAKESSKFQTLAEFKKDIRARLEKQAQIDTDRINEESLLKAVADATDVAVHPKIIDRQYDQVMGELAMKLAQSGMNMEMYAMYNGMTLSQFESKQREYAGLGAKTGLILDAIGKKEGLKTFEAIIKFLKEKN